MRGHVKPIVEEKECSEIRLSADEWAELCKRLDAAPQDLPNMRELLARPSRFVDARTCEMKR